jgi:adenylate cyclase
MTYEPAQRRLTAVLFADMVGFSRLTEIDEDGTYARLKWLRTNVLEPWFKSHGGRLVRTLGDGFVATFFDVRQAAHCAMALQQELERVESDSPADRRIAFRMGLNVCEAIVDADEFYGDGVNIAARLQAYADPGGIVAPAAVAEQIGDELDVATVDLGELYLRNISKPIAAVSFRTGTSAPTRLPPTGDKRPSIAVLPFRGFSPDAEDTYFTDGIVEAIIRGLGGLQELFVIARPSTLRYAGSQVDVRSVGTELGVRYILQGSVRRAGGRLRITTELSDAKTRTVIRSDRYEGDTGDLFALQDRIATEAVASIAPHVRQWELRRALSKHPDSMDAYDLLLQALDLLYRLDYAAFSRARGLLQLAIENDLDYAAPHAYAAQWHIFRISQGWSNDPDADSHEAARLAAMAIERDQQDAMGLALHGHALSWFFKRYDGALVFLERAVRAGPNCAMAWTMKGLSHAYVGEGELAVAHARHALRLSPLDPHAFYHQVGLAFAHYAAGDFAEAAAAGHRAIAQCPRFCAGMRILVASLAALGRLDEAREVGHNLMQVQPNFRLGAYHGQCPFKGEEAVGLMIDRLSKAELPD